MAFNYIPVNEAAQERVENEIKKQGIFGNLDQFILLYNQGFINVSKKEIKELADLIAASYSNIVLQNRKFFVRSAQETYVDQAIFVLNHFSIILAMKRIANELVEDGHDVSEKMVFFSSNPGFVFTEVHGEDGEVTYEKYEAAERLTSSKNTIPSNVYLQPLMKDLAGTEDGYYIPLYELVNLDTSFIDLIHESIEELNTK